jgi:hypothetical protein
MTSARESDRANGGASIDGASRSRPVQMPTVGDRAAASVIEGPAEAEGAKVNAPRGPPGDNAFPSEQDTRLPVQPPPSSTQGAQPASLETVLRREFERFLHERQQTSISPQDKETLFVEFKKLVESKNSQANGLAGTSALPSAAKEGTRRVEIWQSLDTTKLHELPSAASTTIGEVAKGGTFRVIGRSEDGKWLKIETPDGLNGYYWAARAREIL